MNSAAKFRRRIVRAVALPPLLVGVLAAISFGLAIHLLVTLEWVGQFDRLIARAHGTSRTLIEREAALRGHLAAGSPETLQAYRDADVRLGNCLDELARLVADDPEQSLRLAPVRGRSERWGLSASRAIGLQAGPSGHKRPGVEARAEEPMDQIQSSLADFLAAAEESRDRRSAAAQARAWTVLTVCAGAAIALVVVLRYSSRRQLASLIGVFEVMLAELKAQSDRQERENLSLLSEAMRYYAIFTLDVEGRIASWNADAERILGYRPDDVLARRLSCFYAEDEARKGMLLQDLEWAAQEGRVEEEMTLIRKDGLPFKARVSLVAIRDSGGGLCGYTSVVQDIAGQDR